MAGVREGNLGESMAGSQAAPTIVVFGAAVDAEGVPSATLARRLEAALSAARAHPASTILVSGGAVHSPRPEAPAMADWLAGAGIDRARILVDDQAMTSWDTAARVAAIVSPRNGRPRVVLVTSGYHAPRCRLFLRLNRVEVVTTVTPPAERRRMGNAAWLIAIARELGALPWNVLRALVRRLSWT